MFAIILALAWSQGSAVPPSENTLYVAPNGNDRAKGTTAQQPVATIAEALKRVRLRSQRAPTTVRFAPGLYLVRAGITLGKADSHLTFEGVGAAVLDGGVTLNRWGPVPTDLATRLPESARMPTRCATLPAGIDPHALTRKGFLQPDNLGGRRLLYKGQAMDLARYPNPDEPYGGWLQIAEAPRGDVRRFRVPNDRPTHWAKPEEAWVLGYWQYDWAEAWEPVEQWDDDRKWVTLTPKVDNFELMRPSEGRRFFFTNVLEELDQPGEWWIDAATRRVVFWSPEPIQPGDVTVTALEAPLITIKGATGVTIRGMKLIDGSGGGIQVKDSPNTLVTDCEIRGFAKYGVSLIDSPGSQVARCQLQELGETGIALHGGNRMTLEPGKLTATDNVIKRFGQLRRTYNPGVDVKGVGNIVAHNRITDAPHNAILVSGNDHRLEYNDIQRICLETDDSSAIYMGRDTTMRGIQIRFNWFRDLESKLKPNGKQMGVSAIYLDDCFSGVRVEGNILDLAGGGVTIGGGRDNVVVGNVFIRCVPGVYIDERGRTWAKNFMAKGGDWGFWNALQAMRVDQPPYSVRYPSLASVLKDGGEKASGNLVQRNIQFGGHPITRNDGLTLENVSYLNNIIQSDSKVTVANALRLRPANWIKIPIDQIGPRRR